MSFSDEYKKELLATLALLDASKVEEAILLFEKAREEGRMIFVCGNGGSAASSSHFVCDMLKGASYGKEAPRRFKIMSLTDMMPTMTAYSNDVGYEHVFSEPLKNFAQPGDLFMAISGSGNSPNVVAAMEYAAVAGCKTIALTGRDGGKLRPLADVSIHVPVSHMGRIEDAHMIACHMICYRFMEKK